MTQWQAKVLSAVKTIPRGKVTTYQLLAKVLGNANAVRAVGTALKNNPRLIIVPCHRVIKSNGQIGNYSQGLAKKQQLLQNEGINVIKGKIANWQSYLYRFK